MLNQQQGQANFAAPKDAHDVVVYRVMMDKSAAHSSMPLNVSMNTLLLPMPSGWRWWLLLSDSESPIWVLTLRLVLPLPHHAFPNSSKPSGTWHSQVPKWELTHVNQHMWSMCMSTTSHPTTQALQSTTVVKTTGSK